MQSKRKETCESEATRPSPRTSRPTDLRLCGLNWTDENQHLRIQLQRPSTRPPARKLPVKLRRRQTQLKTSEGILETGRRRRSMRKTISGEKMGAEMCR